jgi:uncharacterized protein with PIN domain
LWDVAALLVQDREQERACYIDSSALVKLVGHEPGTPELIARLESHQTVARVSSCLVEIEVARVIRVTVAAIPSMIARIDAVEIDTRIRAVAAAYDDPALRRVDGIHLATAEVSAEDSQEN